MLGVLFGCITAIPVHIRVYDKVNKMAEINFLCVHKKLRFVIFNHTLKDMSI
jgi:glycylpeptide N-tetradecanoyltransferase